jgi:serine/threonine protein kinase
MLIQAGSRLGPYEIESAIGAGGMGEVYRARDTRLGRRVAIKSLPAAFAQDAERVARFKREAQVLAALNHPHIAGIYGLEEVEGAQFLVLELVDGESLADRLSFAASGFGRTSSAPATGGAHKGMSVAETLAIARQIVDALEAAHEKGIIHRDLKPANIALTADGQVKVLDFGLAKYEAGGSNVAADLTASPTMAFTGTQTGIILGTAAYMSPEQAKGLPVDKRSDVWAFGCVLFEMLSGKKAFEAEDVSETLALILRGEPDWSALAPEVPRAIQTLIKRCLIKDRRARIPDLSVVRFLLDDAVSVDLPPVRNLSNVPAPRRRAIQPWIVAGVLLLGAFSVLALRVPRGKSASPPLVRVNILTGASDSVLSRTTLGASVALSPDGSLLAFVTSNEVEPTRLHLRRLDQLQATPLAGTEGAVAPFFSPDGQWVAFFAQGRLKKVSVSGGSPVTLCDAPNPRGGSWGDDGTIAFQPDTADGSRLQRVSSAGGRPEPLVALADGETMQRWPEMLPGTNAVLFTSAKVAGPRLEGSDVVVQSLPGGARTVLITGGYYGRYVSSGHLLYMHEGTLFAAPFDAATLRLTGPSVPALQSVAFAPAAGSAQIAVSKGGLVAYVPADREDNVAPIVWLDQAGKTTPLRPTPDNWTTPSFSPDGTRLAVDISDGSQSDIWTYEWGRDRLSRLTFDTADDVRPVWTPDGRRLTFGSRRGNKSTLNLYWQRADGTGDAQLLLDTPNAKYPGSWHPSGKFLAYYELRSQTNADLMILPMEGDETAGWTPGTPTVFLSTRAGESSPMFSPDGRWLAYMSNESGRVEIYVRPFPGPGGQWQISNTRADDPTWSRTKRELFYLSADLRIMRAPYSVEGDSFHADKPEVWSDARITGRPRPPSRDLDLHPDGQRFAIAPGEMATADKQNKVVLIFNFFDELHRLSGATK